MITEETRYLCIERICAVISHIVNGVSELLTLIAWVVNGVGDRNSGLSLYSFRTIIVPLSLFSVKFPKNPFLKLMPVTLIIQIAVPDH